MCCVLFYCLWQFRVIVALSKRIKTPIGTLEAKAKAFEARFQFAKDMNICDFIIEGDSLIISKALSDLIIYGILSSA